MVAIKKSNFRVSNYASYLIKSMNQIFRFMLLIDTYSIYVYTTTMSKKNQYPEWVEKYRSKGQTIRKVRNGYGLYKCTSVYVPGAPYPKSVQEYLGMITEEDGFIPKKSTTDHPQYIEYGLSRLIWLNFKRSLLRSSFNGHEGLIRLGIVKYIFGDVTEDLINFSFISDGHEDEMISALASSSERRINNIANKIDELLKEKINDPIERKVLENLLRCCVMDSKNRLSQTPALPEKAKEIIERNGLKYGDG